MGVEHHCGSRADRGTYPVTTAVRPESLEPPAVGSRIMNQRATNVPNIEFLANSCNSFPSGQLSQDYHICMNCAPGVPILLSCSLGGGRAGHASSSSIATTGYRKRCEPCQNYSAAQLTGRSGLDRSRLRSAAMTFR